MSTESSEWCEMVPDGADANGDEWNRCTVHDYLVLGDAYVCEGYRPPEYVEPGGASLTERVWEVYSPKVEQRLKEIAAWLREQTLWVSEPFDMSDDCFRWALTVKPTEEAGDDLIVDVSIEMAEQSQYDGEGDGINFGLSAVAWEGSIVAEFQPFNFTELCWVDAHNGEGVAHRWSLVDTVPTDGLYELIAKHYEKVRNGNVD